MRFEVFMVVTILMMFFWIWALCGLAGRSHFFIISFYQPVHMAPKHRRTSSISHLLHIKCNEHPENNDKCQQRTEVESNKEKRLIVDDIQCVAGYVKFGNPNLLPH
jgi:hypothetical protein